MSGKIRLSTPSPVVRRLPKYLTLADELIKDCVDYISSQELGEALGLTSSTVRQDLSHLNISGVSRRGYHVDALKEALKQELGADMRRRVLIVGAGYLGCALVRHRQFEEHGFDIRALFDHDPDVIGRQVGPLTVQPMSELARTASIWTIDIGILTVPSSSAQEVADRLLEVGVRSLLNLAGGHIHAPEEIPVVDARFMESLQQLSHALKAQDERGRTAMGDGDTPVFAKQA